MKPNLFELTLNTRIWYKGVECQILRIGWDEICLIQKDYHEALMTGDYKGKTFENAVASGGVILWDLVKDDLSLSGMPPPNCS